MPDTSELSLSFAEIRPLSASAKVVAPSADIRRLVALHMAYGPTLLRRRNPIVGSRWPNCPLLNDHDALLIAQLDHELDHLHRSLGTSFGLALHAIQVMQVDCFLKRIAQADPNEEISLPFQTSSNNSEEVLASLASFAKCKLIDDILTARAPLRPSIDLPSIESVIEWFLSGDCLSIKQLGTSEGLRSAKRDFGIPQLPHSIGNRTFHRPFGAAAILEVFGVYREVSLRKFAQVAYDRTANLLEVPAYQQAGFAWKAITGNRLERVNKGNTESWRHLVPEGLNTFPVEFYAVCDLALWPPIVPKGVRVDTFMRYDWYDLHPGWRFLRAAEVVSLFEHMTPFSSIDDEIQAVFIATQHKICKSLNWPTPTFIARHWLDSLNDLWKNRSRSALVLHDDWERVEGSIKLLCYRLKKPALAALGYIHGSNDASLYFRIIEHAAEAYTEKGMELIVEDAVIMKDAGYSLPTAYALVKSLDLFVGKRDERHMDDSLKEIYGRFGRRIESDLSNYTSRHYGFRVTSGRQSS